MDDLERAALIVRLKRQHNLAARIEKYGMTGERLFDATELAQSVLSTHEQMIEVVDQPQPHNTNQEV